MKNSQILENFFEKHRQHWKKDCYTVFKNETRPNALLSGPTDPADRKNKLDRRTPSPRGR